MNKSSNFSFCVSCSLSEAFVDSAVISSYEFSSLLMFPFDCSSVVKCIIGSIVGTLSDFCSTGFLFYSYFGLDPSLV